MNGFLLVDKPIGPTSREAMTEATAVSRRTKVGVEGILDPFASGLLVVGIGTATRFFQYLHTLPKQYEAVLQLGVLTNTLDPEGEVVERADIPPINKAIISDAMERFRGETMQTPPVFSNARLAGARARELAREGKEVKLQPRRVVISSLESTGHSKDQIQFKATVAAGTYIRSLGRDLAEALGTVGHLLQLRRTHIGALCVDDACLPADCSEEHILTSETVLGWIEPLALQVGEGNQFLNGQRIEVMGEPGLTRVFVQDRFVGLGKIEGGRLHPERLLPTK